MTTSFRTRAVREALPAIECTPWCVDQDGHTDVTHPDDQWCGGVEQRVTLSRVPLIKLCDDSWRLDDMRAYLVQDRFEAEPKVHLGRGDAQGVYLTVGEARQLAEALLLLADQVEE